MPPTSSSEIPITSTPVVAPTVPTPMAIPNTSGQGSASVLPDEIKGWNWGAFGFNWIWGVCNGTWIALLMFVPLVNIVMWILLGLNGNEWAWRNKKWESIEQFKKVQHTWAKVWVILVIIVVVLCIVLWSSLLFLVASLEAPGAHHTYGGDNSGVVVPQQNPN